MSVLRLPAEDRWSMLIFFLLIGICSDYIRIPLRSDDMLFLISICLILLHGIQYKMYSNFPLYIADARFDSSQFQIWGLKTQMFNIILKSIFFSVPRPCCLNRVHRSKSRVLMMNRLHYPRSRHPNLHHRQR